MAEKLVLIMSERDVGASDQYWESILRESASLSSVKLVIESHVGQSAGVCTWESVVSLGGTRFKTAFGRRKIESREKAAADTFNELKMTNYLLITQDANCKSAVNCGLFVKKEEPAAVQPLFLSPVIAQMMKEMGGWSEGGLGLHSQGIITPIKAKKWKGREGFGFNKAMTPMQWVEKLKNTHEHVSSRIRLVSPPS